MGFPMIEFLGSNTWVAIVFSGIIGLLAALYTVRTQRLINRRRATVDMIMNKNWDSDYINTSTIFYDAMKDQKKLIEIYDRFVEVRDLKTTGKWDDLPEPDRASYESATKTVTAIKSILNDRELVAIGIREGTYDEVIYRRWWYSTFMLEWRLSSSLISRMRTDPALSGGSQYAYRDMEALARRWEAEGPWLPRERHYQLPGGRVVTIQRAR